jgi:hypothetical protein
VQEVGLDAGGRERGVVSLQKHNTHDVVTDVALTLQLKEQHTLTRMKQEISRRKILTRGT